MTAIVNDATGEVTQTIAGKEYRFKATMPKMAEYQARLAVPGLSVTMMLLQQSDPRAIYHGLMSLCVSDNAKDFENMILAKCMVEAKEALILTLGAGLPDQPDKPGKAKAAKRK